MVGRLICQSVYSWGSRGMNAHCPLEVGARFGAHAGSFGAPVKVVYVIWCSTMYPKRILVDPMLVTYATGCQNGNSTL